MDEYLQGLKITIKLMTNYFEGEINITALYVYLNVIVKNSLIIFLGSNFVSFLDIKRTC